MCYKINKCYIYIIYATQIKIYLQYDKECYIVYLDYINLPPRNSIQVKRHIESQLNGYRKFALQINIPSLNCKKAINYAFKTERRSDIDLFLRCYIMPKNIY